MAHSYTMVVDYEAPDGEIIGTLTHKVKYSSGRVSTYVHNFVYGRQLASGSYQLYTIDTGSISKIVVMKEQALDWTNTLRKNDGKVT